MSKTTSNPSLGALIALQCCIIDHSNDQDNNNHKVTSSRKIIGSSMEKRISSHIRNCSSREQYKPWSAVVRL